MPLASAPDWLWHIGICHIDPKRAFQSELDPRLFNLKISIIIVTPKKFQRFMFWIWEIFFGKYEKLAFKCSNFVNIIYRNMFFFNRSKFYKLRGFQRKSLKFSKENLSNPKHESLKCFWCNYEDFEYQIIKDLDPFHSEMTFLNQSATYLSSRAQGPPPPPPPPAPLVPSPQSPNYAPSPWQGDFLQFLRGLGNF